MKSLEIPKSYIEEAISAEKKEAERRLSLYRKDRRAPEIKDQIIILVDDGIATGSTMMAAALASREAGAQKIIIAVPVAPPSSLDFLSSAADEIVCLYSTEDLMAISQFYEEFHQVKDEEILSLLH